MRISSKPGRTLLLLIILVTAVSCNFFNPSPEVESQEDPSTLPYDRKFSAYNFGTERYYPLYALYLIENEQCIIYGENTRHFPQKTIQAVATEYKEKIYPKVTGVFGEPQRKKLTILLLDIIDGIPAGAGSYVSGYFNSADSGVLYMDAAQGLPGTQSFNATIAHELQHMLRYSFDPVGHRTPSWLNEGLSTAAEYIYLGKHLDESFSYYNKDPYGTIANGNNFFYWEGTDLADYSTAYLFFQWLRIQTPPMANDPKGFRIYKKIYENLNKSSGDSLGTDAVVHAARDLINKNLDSWDELLQAWLTANYLRIPDKSSTLGLYGYGNEFTKLEFHPYSEESSFKMLHPGEGVFSTLAADGFTLPENESGAHVGYVQLKEGEAPVYGRELKQFTGDFLLTFNGNTDSYVAAGRQELGYVTGEKAPKQTKATPRAGDWTGAPIRIDGTSLLPPQESTSSP